MVIKKKTKNITPVYRQSNLVTASSFISYCRENGVHISREHLELWHKNGWLYPALKIYKGTVEHTKILADFDGKEEWGYVSPKDIKKFKIKKIDGKKYYTSGGFYMSGDNWVDWYKKRKMVVVPAEEKFTPRKKKKILETFTTNLKAIADDYEYFYDKRQIFAIKSILRATTFGSKLSAEQKKYLQKRLNELNQFLRWYNDMEIFLEDWQNIYSARIQKLRDEGFRGKNLRKEWSEIYDIDYRPELKKRAASIIKEHNIDATLIKEWRQFLTHQTFFYETKRSWSMSRTYLRGMNERSLAKIEDVNYMILVINFVLNLLTGEEMTLKQTLLETAGGVCTVCGCLFIPKKEFQITCGDPDCVRANKNQYKRKMRRIRKEK